MTSSPHPSAQYAITLRLECPHSPGWIARISSAIAAAGGAIGAIDLVQIQRGRSLRDHTVESGSAAQARQVIEAVKGIDGVVVHSVQDKTFALHRGGKLATVSRVPLETRADLSMAYTPGVARVCKAILFKEFGGVDAFPICLDTQDTEEIIRICTALAPTFGGINLEDIAAPRCFTIEERLQEALEIPVFHDDQHGTAVVVLAANLNALKLTGKRAETMKLVVAGAGAAGFACIRTLHRFGMENIVACDRDGAIHAGRDVGDNPVKDWLREHTNPSGEKGSLREVLAGADMFLGLSGPGLLDAGDLPGCPGRPCPGHQRGDEAGGGSRHRRPHPPGGPVGGLHHPQRLQPQGRPGGGGRRGPGRPRQWRRPPDAPGHPPLPALLTAGLGQVAHSG